MPSRKVEGLSIGEVSERFGVPVSTLRYYDRQGLFPGLGRKGGQRRFSREDVETLRMIECLKASGLEIAQIRRFMEAVGEGPSTYGERAALFHGRRDQVAAEMERIRGVLEVLDYKCWYYDELLAGADEAALRALGEEAVPEEHRAGWRRIHEEMAAGGRDEG
ncbi:MerR family transcriptional regulator [Caniella muris]|uniref:MerR family transcriptional regulator n=1 Tax=Caniella muris TaxID=2941502 RepID=UPI002041615A|nr:MerR family transcriptional regulator [Caniella muris]